MSAGWFIYGLAAIGLGGPILRWSLGKAGVMRTIEEAEAINRRENTLSRHIEDFNADLDCLLDQKRELDRLPAGVAPILEEIGLTRVIGKLGDLEEEAAELNSKWCWAALEKARYRLITDFGLTLTEIERMKTAAAAHKQALLERVFGSSVDA